MRAAHGVASAAADGPGAIPHTLSEFLCIDFVNSRFSDHTGSDRVYDRIDLPEWRVWFSARCGVPVARAPSAVVRRRLLDLRVLLRALLVSAAPPTDHGLAQLNRVLASSSQVWRLARDKKTMRYERVWRHPNWDAVMAATVASYAQLLVAGGTSRVKVCANPDCTYMFYDESRNRSRRWCDPGACGTLLRVRRYRGSASVSGTSTSRVR